MVALAAFYLGIGMMIAGALHRVGKQRGSLDGIRPSAVNIVLVLVVLTWPAFIVYVFTQGKWNDG